MAAGVTDGAIIVDTALDTTGIAKGVRVLQGMMTRLRDMFTSLGRHMAGSGNSFVKALGGNALRAELAQTEARIKEIIAEMERMEDAGDTASPRYAELSAELENLSVRWVELQQAANSANDAGVRGVGRLGAAVRKLGGLIGQAAKKLFSLNRTHQKSLGLGGMSIKRLAALGLGIGSLASLFNKLRSAISEGMENLAKHDSAVKTALNNIKKSLATLKANLASAFAPILTAVAPALVTLINLLNKAVTAIGMFLSALMGKPFYNAPKAAGAVANSIGGISSAASAAADDTENLKRELAGFDELNILKDTSGGGSPGGGGGDPGIGYTPIPVDDAISDFAKRLREAIESENWQLLGTLLADKLNAMIDNIDWAGIGKKIGGWINSAIQTAYWFLSEVDFQNLGAKIATMLNSALSEIDFTYLGRLFTRGFTLIFDGLIGFLTELDWGLIAGKFSDGIKGAFDEFSLWLDKHDWSSLGSTLWGQLKSVFTNIDWGGIASSMFTAFGKAIRSGAQFLGGFFGDIGADIKNWWNTSIKGENWQETATNLLSAIGKGFKSIGSWVWNNIIDPFGKALLGEKWEQLKGVAVNIWNKIKDGWNSIKDKTVEFVAKVKDTAREWWGEVREYWRGGTENLVQFTASVRETWPLWKAQIKNAFDPDGKVAEFTVAVKNTMPQWKQQIARDFDPEGKVAEFHVAVKNESTKWWRDITNYFDPKGQTVQFAAAVKNDASKWWSSITSYFTPKSPLGVFRAVVQDTRAQWQEQIKAFWRIDTPMEFVAALKNTASQWWIQLKALWKPPVMEFVASIKDTAKDWWQQIKDKWKDNEVVQFSAAVKNDATAWLNNVKHWWDVEGFKAKNKVGITPSVENNVKALWGDVQSWWGSKSREVKAKLGLTTPKPKVEIQYKKVLGFDIPFPKYTWSWNARGGILDGATLFGMLGNTLLGGGEAGKEAVLPLERNTSWMDTLAEHVWNYHAPNVASGSLMPYEVSAQIAQTGQSIENAMNANSEDIIQTIISVASQIVAAVHGIQGGGFAGGATAQDVINAINRRSKMYGASPLEG